MATNCCVEEYTSEGMDNVDSIDDLFTYDA